jgi:hypothetical protein
MRVHDLLQRRGIQLGRFREAVEHDVRYGNISTIEGTDANQYSIGMVVGA